MTYTAKQLRELSEEVRRGEPIGLTRAIEIMQGYAAALEEIERLVTDNGKLNAALNNARSMFAAGCSYTKDGDPEFFCGNIEEFFSALSANVESADSSDEIERLKHDLTRATETGAEPATRAERAEAALAECRAKLEVDPRTKYDGIDSRDETIRLLENELEESARLHGMGASREAALQARLAESERKCARLKHHAEAMAEDLDAYLAEVSENVSAYRDEFKE